MNIRKSLIVVGMFAGTLACNLELPTQGEQHKLSIELPSGELLSISTSEHGTASIETDAQGYYDLAVVTDEAGYSSLHVAGPSGEDLYRLDSASRIQTKAGWEITEVAESIGADVQAGDIGVECCIRCFSSNTRVCGSVSACCGTACCYPE